MLYSGSTLALGFPLCICHDIHLIFRAAKYHSMLYTNNQVTEHYLAAMRLFWRGDFNYFFSKQ
jgi:hypothetical protein